MLGELHFDSVAAILESNTSFFMGRMTQEGRTTEEAKAEFAALLDLLRRFDSLRGVDRSVATRLQMRVEGKWK